jgi:hypothetical protein
MLDVTLTVLSGIIIGLIAVFKKIGLPSNWCPLIAVALGVVGVFCLDLWQPTATVIFTGVALGLGAVGLYEFGKQGIKIVK